MKKNNARWNLLEIFLVVIALIIINGQSVCAKGPGVIGTFLNYIEDLKVKTGKSEKNVIIFPVLGNETLKNNRILALDEAMEKGVLIIKELAQENVNRIMVQNNSEDSIFIMAGEILTGSKQDRILKDDLLLPPKSGNIIVNAYCVEKGRWSYKTEKFSTNKTASNIKVRQQAREFCDQNKIWSAVNEIQKSCGYTSSTGALNDTYSSPVVHRSIDNLYDQFKNLPKEYPGMNGACVVIGNEILCADLFGKGEIFQKLWPKLLKSYLLEAHSKGRSSSKDIVIKDIREFLSCVSNARIQSTDAPGVGILLKIESGDITGSALTSQNELIHADIFPRSSEKKDIDEVQPIQRSY